MSDCKKCFHACVCKKRPMIDGATIVNCRFFITDEPQTNADRIRAMNDEALKDFICDLHYDCCECSFESNDEVCKLADWLKQPVEEDKND